MFTRYLSNILPKLIKMAQICANNLTYKKYRALWLSKI